MSHAAHVDCACGHERSEHNTHIPGVAEYACDKCPCGVYHVVYDTAECARYCTCGAHYTNAEWAMLKQRSVNSGGMKLTSATCARCGSDMLRMWCKADECRRELTHEEDIGEHCIHCDALL